MTIATTALAFVRRHPAQCHNAKTDGTEYVLHKSTIARWMPDGTLRMDWCGYYTKTTAAHINAILAAYGSRKRVSYAEARDVGAGEFVVNTADVADPARCLRRDLERANRAFAQDPTPRLAKAIWQLHAAIRKEEKQA